ncbi:MAG: 4-(cytidine 5'-diphospho)-2-C-methyl-D-erythritol kinase [Lachnospiraceae bacterium]|nr:4-(cytidine 5'-diphospho)-2-C-methyl-D-erythritol kinase [Lachnospiraceae bacterium]
MNDKTVIKAHGKINLALDIIGRRPDGYHEVSMIMQSVSLDDELVFEKTDVAGLKLRLGNLPSDDSEEQDAQGKSSAETNCESGTSVSHEGGMLPVGSDNIIFKAYRALNERYSLGGVECTLTKNIPIAAGMAGGSTDAAATLKALRELFSLDISDSELAEIAVGIGADVPYCLMGGTALSEGIGEKLTALPALPKCCILLVHPDIPVSTKDVYNAYDRAPHTFHPDIPAIKSCISKGDLKGMCELAGNVLEEATIPMHPEIKDIKNKIKEFAPLLSLMTGSGPTVFGIFDDEAKAREAYTFFKETQYSGEVFLTEPN